ncbi:hypothetical protein EYC51_06695 [Alcaligenes faecalis]|nr:hypothetical protein EYC51_06695 [Alcaligenes faecalis]
MTQSVLFLDDASRHVGAVGREAAQQCALALLRTLKYLRKINKKFVLSTAIPLRQYEISDDWTLQSALGGDEFKDHWRFLQMLQDRSPFSAEMTGIVQERIDRMELNSMPGVVASRALAWATVLDAGTVSFQAHPDWSGAWVETAYCELDDEGNVFDVQGRVRNISEPEHTNEHLDWLKALGYSKTPTSEEIWQERADRFPGLRFLSSVRKDLAVLDGSGLPFRQALEALESLASVASGWPFDAVEPTFPGKMTPEHEGRKRSCWFHDDETGQQELFDKHIRFTGGIPGRIHFRLDVPERSIIIAYVGHKLERKASD